MVKSLCALIVEDSQDDALLIARRLRLGGYDLTYKRVDTAESLHAALDERAWDLVIADYALPRFSGMAALELIRDRGLDLPFIIVSGTIGEELAVKAMKAGAHDYVMKDNLVRLLPAVERELQERDGRRARRQAEESLRLAQQEMEERRLYLEQVLAAAPDAIVTLDAEGRVVEWNRGAERLFGYGCQEAKGQTLDRLINDQQGGSEANTLTRRIAEGDNLAPSEVVRYRRDGVPVDVIASGSPIQVDGEQVGAVAIYTDISERKRAERLLRGLNEAALAAEQVLTLDDILDAVGQEFAKLGFHYAVLVLDEGGQELRPAYFSYEGKAVRLAEKLLGLRSDQVRLPVDGMEVISRVIRGRETVLVEGAGVVRGALPRALRGFAPQLIKMLKVTKSIDAPLIVEDQVIGLLAVQSDDLVEEDVPAITAFAHQVAAAWRRAQLMQDLEESLEELTRTQAQFLQAQKMEAVGRLAGGVAHDFNNALTIIRLSLQLLKRRLHPDDPLWEYVEQIEVASDRATGLTKQLLSFSRREIVEPQVLALNEIVENLSQMLQRIIGEDIELVISLGKDLWPVYMDATQVDQVIINLVVNARDAMAYGGVLSIETDNVVLDAAYAAGQVDVEPGEYVLLMVSDTGKGMDKEVKAHIFEPFFTTKERGEGTGLGLATVYGIVKGCDGHIGVYSEPGQGTTFRIYLPRSDEAKPQSPTRPSAAQPVEGTETVLLVEDDVSVREMATKILETYGYQVLAAGSGPQAIDLVREHDGAIHLLLTDVVLPQMSGRELAEALHALRPGIRVLYMSGYSESTIAHHGVGSQRFMLLPKPFTVETMVHKVRSALDAPN